MTSLSCAVVGEGHIALNCLRYLVENDFHVKAVFTNTSEILLYCEENNLRVFRRRSNLQEDLEEKEFDFLFSINNPTILSPAVLSIPRKLSINYHDSPLPLYAGVHATSWALINGETEHGISWHVVEPGIDTGDILQSQCVEIGGNDSAFSLNMKCLEAAFDAFRKLVSDIQNSSIQGHSQEFNRRSYYGLYELPPRVGILDFNQGLFKTYNLARALEFGNHDNRLGSPKIISPNGYPLLVTNAKICDEIRPRLGEDNAIGNCPPGTVLSVKHNTLLVSVKPGILSLAISELDGRHLNPGLLVKYAIEEGAQLSSVSDYANEAMLLMAKKEQFWRVKMKKYEPTTLFIQKLKVTTDKFDDQVKKLETIELPIPDVHFPNIGGELKDAVAAAFIAFLARSNCSSVVHVGLVAGTQDILPSYLHMYAEICPSIFQFDLSAPLKDALKQCVQTLARHKEAKTFLTDMFYRYPELREMKRTPHHNLVIGFEDDCLKDEKITSLLSDSNVVVTIGIQSIKLSYFTEAGSSQSYLSDLLQHFPTFLQSLMLKDCTQALPDVSLISPLEVDTLYKPLHDDVEEQSGDLIDLFQQVCSTHGNAVAVKTTDAQLTYNELIEEVGSLASLISSNLPQTYRTDLRCMALYMPNSLAYVVSLLSSVISNIPFLPLPEKTPSDRMAFMLKDSSVSVMLTTDELFMSDNLTRISSNSEVIFKVETRFGSLVMLLFEIEEKINGVEPGQRHNTPTEELCDLVSVTYDADDRLGSGCCYVMYTSGSTGKPKGVQVNSAGVVNMALSQIDQWDITQNDTVAQFASIGFDASISEIFTAVLSGACLAVLKENQRLGREFIDTLIRHEVTVITLPPSVLNIYGPTDLPTLKKVVTAGEACTFVTAMRWTKESNVRFFNAYGPTETTVCATIFEFSPGKSDDLSTMDLPIGEAIHGVSVYLFDHFKKPVPPGVVGEIYIGGSGLAAGYVGHARAKTCERFIQNPLDPTEKLYKTGDHAIQDKHGCLTYIGRLDDQVKIRGQRVDLSEIEQVILQHPNVETAVVVKHQSVRSSNECVAAFVAPPSLLVSEIREYLAKILPCYMMPTHIKKMDTKDFPLTMNGKIDRKMLQKDQSVDESKYLGASHLSPIQLSIAKLWCSVLLLEESFAYTMHKLSTFSEFGGNSLHMVLLQRAIEEHFGIMLSFTEIGMALSIEDFAELITDKGLQTKSTSENDIQNQLMMDAVLDLQTPTDAIISNMSEENNTEPKHILLSGCTGFLGAFLLYEMFQQSNSLVYCMVRESTRLKGFKRIEANLRKYGMWKPDFESRITVILSDLSKSGLGIVPDIYESLSTTIDVVFMNAAKMNFNTDYSDHQKANVDGTKEFIRFSMTGRKKFLFTTSSLAVFLFPPPLTSQAADSSDSLNSPDNSAIERIRKSRIAGLSTREDTTYEAIRGDEFAQNEKNLSLSKPELFKIFVKNIENSETTSPDRFTGTSLEFPIDRSLLQFDGFDLAKDPSSLKLKGDKDSITKGEKKERLKYREEEVQNPCFITGGYGQSKWVSEKLVYQALSHLPGGAVFRPARVSGHSETGVGPTNDLFASILRGIGQLGCIPDIDFPYDLTPVDYCAMGMVEIMLKICRGENQEMPQTYHFFNRSTIPFHDLFEDLSVKRVSLQEWREKVRKAHRDNPLVPLTPFIFSPFWERSVDWPIFDTTNTDQFTSAECKKRLLSSKALLPIYQKFFKESEV